MLQRLLLLLPETGPAWAWYWWVALTGGGLLLWLAGARVSRPLVTLLLVTAGALAGKYVPPGMGWAVDPMAAIVGTALVAGIAGFALHRWAVGLGLGAVAGLWAVLGCWAVAAGPSYWQWPRRLSELAELKSRLDPQLWQMMLALGGLTAVTGVAVSVLFPRVATTLFWTLTGCSIWCGGAVAWAFYSGPDRLARLPQGDLAQGLLLAAIVLAGFLAQWWQGPGPLKESKAAGGGGVPAAA